MSEEIQTSHPKEQFLCSHVEGFDALSELALNMRADSRMTGRGFTFAAWAWITCFVFYYAVRANYW